MESIARSIVLIALFVAPDYSYGLICKLGGAHKSSENATIGPCEGGDRAQYCLDVICVKENMPTTAVMFWACSDQNDTKACADYYEDAYNKTLHTTNASCKCNFGEKGKDRTNVEAKLPEIPKKPKVSLESVCKEPGFKCKFGIYTENGYGQSYIGDCKEGVYCYAISCKIGNSTFTFWGVAVEENCYRLSDYFAFGFPCDCKFGKKGVELSNMNFMLPAYLTPSSLVSHIRANRGTRANISILFVWLMSLAFFFAASASLLKKQ
ncbi:hypothetical protein GPALN_002987 [Globodera pallida]|nr:hypothetical protein GPALN_002987 [Globodera pallida]